MTRRLALLVALFFALRGVPSAATLPAASGNSTLTTTDLVKRSIPTVVRIQGSDATGSEIAGSGFIVDASGVIVTNLHVVAGLRTVVVRLANGDAYDKVTVRGFDERKDIAILKVAGFGFPTLSLGNSDSVEVGQRVVLIGNPLALDASVTTGVISGVRAVEEGYRVIQTDAAANPGNSGGPLLDESGRAIGILTFKIRGAENLNFVVPINYVRGLLADTTTLTLDELRNRLTGIASTLSKPGLPSRWKSLVSGSSKVLRIFGEHVYIEDVLSTERVNAGEFAIAELRKDSTGYSGVLRSHLRCPKTKPWSNEVTGYSGWCSEEAPFRITLLSPARIEGEVMAYGESDWVRCPSCTHSTKPQMFPFAWIPD
jgi:serine protease Do